MRLAAAVDVGATNTKLGIVADDGAIQDRATQPTPPTGERLVAAIAATLLPLVAAARARASLVNAVGISVAGFLDADRHTMYGNANLPDLCGFPLHAALQERLGLPCRLECDSNAAVLAEYRYGAGRNTTRLLGVTVGTGLGGAIVLDGRLLRYTGECAGDIGHIIVEPNGRLCTCGAHGCLEAMVCTAAISERAGGEPVANIIRAATGGDTRARDALAETGRWLGLGLASLVQLFAPEAIVVGGGVAAAGALLLEPARASYGRNAGTAFRSVRIVGSSFEGWEGMIGAASLALEPVD
jgi:glucokinase